MYCIKKSINGGSRWVFSNTKKKVIFFKITICRQNWVVFGHTASSLILSVDNDCIKKYHTLSKAGNSYRRYNTPIALIGPNFSWQQQTLSGYHPVKYYNCLFLKRLNSIKQAKILNRLLYIINQILITIVYQQ